jgi:RHH-type transcriptional regulator, rel operon repressor / antitoxin RelB
MKPSTSVVRISRALDVRLDALAIKTGRRKSYYASKAIEQYLEDCEDYLLAVSAYEESKGKERYSLAEVEQQLGVEGGDHASRRQGAKTSRGARSGASKKISQDAG